MKRFAVAAVFFLLPVSAAAIERDYCKEDSDCRLINRTEPAQGGRPAKTLVACLNKEAELSIKFERLATTGITPGTACICDHKWQRCTLK